MRWGTTFGFTMPLFTLASLGLFWKFYETKQRLYLNLTMFALGLGLNTKGWFIWFIIAFFTNIAIWGKYYRIKIRTILVSLCFMFLGILPIIYYAIRSRGQLASFILQNFYITNCGINNSLFIKNLLLRLSQLKMLINQDAYTGVQFQLVRNFPLFFFVFIIGWLLCLMIIWRKTIFLKPKVIFLLSLTLLTFIVSAFTFSEFRPGHLYIIFPYLQIIMAIAICEIINFLKYRGFKILFFLIILMFFTSEIEQCLKSHRFYKNVLALNTGSSEYDIASWVSQKQYKRIVWCDYLYPAYLFFLNNNHIEQNLIAPFFIKDKNDIKQFSNMMVYEIIRHPENVYFFVNIEHSLEYNTFIYIVNKLGKQIVEDLRLTNHKGEIRFIACFIKN
jgi:hypothetical protein